MPRSFRVGTGVAVCTAGALLFAPLIATPAYAAPSTSVVISEVYAHGGNASAEVNSKYVELYNPTDTDIPLDGWSLQYRSATGTSALTNIVRPTGTIKAGGHYLVATGANNEGQGGAALPAGDPATGGINIGGGGGTVFLVEGTQGLQIAGRQTGLENAGDLGIVDFVGWGSAATFESTVAPGVSDAKSISRPGTDTDVNGTDFVQTDPTPTNSAGETLGEDAPEPTPEPTDPSPQPSDPAEPGIRSIAEIQGTGAETPFKDQKVITEGVVTAKYSTGGLAGYYLQTEGTGAALPTGGSEGIFVYSPNTLSQIEVGQFVELAGTATEYNGLTQIKDVTSVAPAEGAFAVPVALDVPLPGSAEAREAIEGMLLQPSDDFTISGIYGADRYGTIGLAVGEPVVQPTAIAPVGTPAHEAAVRDAAERLIKLDDGSSWDYWTTDRNGETPQPWVTAEEPLSIGTGVTFDEPVIMDWRFNAWTLQPTSYLTGDSAKPVTFSGVERDASVAAVGGDISVANFNVLNYFTTTGDEWNCSTFKDKDGDPVSTDDCDARGAADDANLKRQADKIVSAVNALDASVVGLSEIENSAKFGQDRDVALSDLVARLNAAAGEERWAFVPSPATVPAAADEDFIRNALIYQRDVVEPIGASSILTGSPAFSNAREPLAQVFRPIGGEPAQDTVVIVNHFKSKSASGASGDNADEGEGAWTADRVRQAEALVAFAKTVQEAAGTQRALLIGDFNSYAKEAPLAVLEKAGYVNVGETTGKHTYSFGDMVGSLDHVFASAGTTVTGTDIWNINSTESTGFEYSKYNFNVVNLYDAGPYRSSDHDPIKVGLDLSAEPETTTIQVLGINDFHGRIAGSGQVAGAATLGGAVQYFREQNENTLFVSAGDNIGASTFESLLQDDNPTIDALVAAGLDAGAVGNHEFDKGWADLRDRVIPRFAEQADLDENEGGRYALGANVYLAGTDTPALDEYYIQDFDGVKVAVVATLVENMDELVNKSGIADLEFGSQVEAANRVAAQLSDGDDSNGEADVIVVLSHDGSASTSCADVQSGQTPFGELVRDASPAIDAIISAHTHTAYDCSFPVEGNDVERPVIQAGAYTELLDRLEFEVDAQGEVVSVTAELVDLVGGPVAFDADPAVAKIVDDALAEAAVLGARPIGSISADILRGGTPAGADRTVESSASNFVADVQLWATSKNPDYSGQASQIAIMNPGGVRDDLLYAGNTTTGGAANTDGVVTYREAYLMQPFGNTLVTMDMTGAQIVQALEEQIKPDRSLHLGLSANVDYVYDRAAAQGQRVTALEIDGQPVAPDQVVRVTANSFLATGSGDGFSAFGLGENRRDSGLVDLTATLSYFEKVQAACDVVDPSATGRARAAGTEPVRGEVLDIVDACAEEPGEPGGPGEPGNPNPGDPGAGTPGTGAEKPATAPAAAPASALTAALENLITSNDRSLSAGETIRIFVGEQYAGDWVQVWLYSDPVLLGGGWLQVDPTGYVTVELPDELPAGAHRLAVLDADGNVIGWQSVTVADTGVAALPDTGAQVAPVLVFAALMLAAGAVLVIARRRAAQA